jgi:hypothetical protein
LTTTKFGAIIEFNDTGSSTSRVEQHLPMNGTAEKEMITVMHAR